MTAADSSHCFYGNQYDSNSTYPCANYPQNQFLCTCNNCTADLYPALGPYKDQPPVCYNGTGTGSRVQNVTVTFDPSKKQSFGDEALTTYLLWSKNAFLQERYGGVSFGHERSEVNSTLDEVKCGSSSSYLCSQSVPCVQNVPEDGPFLATRQSAKVWYSAKGYHAMPSYLNVMNNALMRGSLPPEKQQSQYGTFYICAYVCSAQMAVILFTGFKTISHPFKTSDISKQYYAIT